jgi:arylsulfatase A-like enzyme
MDHTKLNYLILTACAFLSFTCITVIGLNNANAQAAQKPNVILIMTDDQGYGDLGFHGNDIIKTPNLDQFFGESVRATNFHVSPTCSPSRGAVMTGRYANRVGPWHTIAGRSLLFEDEKILPQVFAENGYATGMFGKWHLGDNYPLRPEDRGFQEVVRHGGGGISQGPDYWGNDYFNDTYWHNGETQEYEGYCTDVFFREGLKFIEEHQNEPFMAYIALNAAHGPFHVPEKYYDLYEDEGQILEVQKRFYGMITNIDDNMGRLEDKLQALGIAKNTILIFMADNGTARGLMQEDGETYGYNAGLRGTKGSEYEGGHRVPFAIKWPDGNIGRDKDIDQLLVHIDLLPTLADLADLRFTAPKPLDGKSFAPLLKETNAEWGGRTLIVDSQRTLSLVKWRRSAVMDDSWRLINGEELYNINQDLSQTKDVASEHPEVVNRLKESYSRWWDSLVEQKVNQRYAYIKAGSRYENPVRISAHDMQIYPYSYAWHQYGALEGAGGRGKLKVEISRPGTYRISLRRYPRESGLSFNQNVPAKEETIEISSPMPANNNEMNMEQATLYLADISETKPIKDNMEEVYFEGYIHAGKYDMTAILEDAQGRTYPSYYTYIERISE